MGEDIVVRVSLGARAYDVVIGRGLMAQFGPRLRSVARGRRAHIVADQAVWPRWRSQVRASLEGEGFSVSDFAYPAGEGIKSFGGLEKALSDLFQAGLTRSDVIVAFGGGSIGDLAGFAASIALRGIDYVQVPTTLLAQVDSSVGGKTAINAAQGKNLIGAFHQPKLVLADLDALSTLPLRERRAGYAEIVKYGLIDDRAFFAFCEGNGAQILELEGQSAAQAVARSIAAKARIVALDETESGPRALLNLGHTFGHALEAVTGYGPALNHGEAVAHGLRLAFRFSAHLGLCPAADVQALERHMSALGFAAELDAIEGFPFDPAALLQAMRADKKSTQSGIRFVLARGIGQAFLSDPLEDPLILDFLTAQIRKRTDRQDPTP